MEWKQEPLGILLGGGYYPGSSQAPEKTQYENNQSKKGLLERETFEPGPEVRDIKQSLGSFSTR